MKKLCVLYDDEICSECGECDICDMDGDKKCDNCEKCLMSDADYAEIEIDAIE